MKQNLSLILLFINLIVFSQGSNEVGVTAGELSVSLTGSATYSIPIAVPPGINGVVPQIGLQYNSQGDNGLVGYGWNISGLSAITKINSTKFHDGKSDPVDFDSLDRFALDGQRLISSSVNYGSNGSRYSTENYSNLIITAYGTHPNGSNYGPGYFIVQYPDGTIAHYGNSTDSKSITTWALNYWENPQGINIKYSYTLSENNLVINTIKYGSKGVSPAINEIIFVYKNRERVEQSYINGQNIMKTKILSSIVVNGNGTGFRNYYLEHGTTDLSYEKLMKITEKSGDNSIAYNPTIFDYGDNTNSNVVSLTQYTLDREISERNMKGVAGDFDGDGDSDFIFYSKNGTGSFYTLYNNLTTSTNNIAISKDMGTNNQIDEILASTIITGSLSTGFKVKAEESWTVITSKAFQKNLYKFTTYSLSNTSQVVKENEKELELCTSSKTGIDEQFKKFISGDFNGDGFTDVILLNGKAPSFSHNCSPLENSVFFIDLRKDIDINYTKNLGVIANIPNNISTKIDESTVFNVLDFNGDGKTDFMFLDKNNFLRIFSLNDANTGLIELVQFSDNSSVKNEIFIGDFNGDGKSDFVCPVVANQDKWNFYISNGLSFVKIADKSIGVDYLPRYQPVTTIINSDGVCVNCAIGERRQTTETLFVIKDVNGDGKSDILCQTYKQNDYYRNLLDNVYTDVDVPLRRDIHYIANKSITATDITFSTPTSTNLNTLKIGAIPLMTAVNKGEAFVLDYSYVAGNKIVSFAAARSQKTDLLLNKVTLGNGVSETITYKPLKEEVYTNLSVYTPQRDVENYPNMDVVVASPFKVVSKIEKQSSTEYKKKMFFYHGAVVNLEGLGFLGFRANMETDWYNDTTPIISYFRKSNINLRGNIFESYKVLGLVPLSSNYIPTTFIEKTAITYNANPLLSNKVFRLQKIKVDTFNGLDGFSSSNVVTYNGLNNPTQSVTTIKNGSTLPNVIQVTTENYTYYPTYTYLTNYKIIDALNKKNVSIQVFPSNETTTSEEVFAYTAGNLVSQIKKKGHLTNYLTEDNLFDTYGNITKKTITAVGLTPRVSNFFYDNTGRFLIKSQNIEGLNTDYTYNTSTGQLLTEILPSNSGSLLKTTHEYDKWGKKIKATNYLNKSEYYSYSNYTNGGVLIAKTADDGSESKMILDDLGREIVSGVKNIDNNWSFIKIEYDIFGRKVKISEPFANLTTPPTQFTQNTFNEYGQLTRSISNTGKITNITYTHGGTSSVNDGFNTVTTVKDPLGKAIRVTDNGGTIYYEYFANGNLKKTYANGSISTIEQDGWGRKTKLIDPVAGEYQYAYNDFGEPLMEKTPNGQTNYKYDNFGKVTEKTIVGLNTNSKETFTYNETTKLLISSRFDDYKNSNFTNYSYGYDNYKRLNFKDESGFLAYYQQAVEFDTFGRPIRQLYTAINTADNKRSDKWFKNTYKNGYHWQVLDSDSNHILWQTNAVNERGQLTSANYGNNIGLNQGYDQYGYLQHSRHFNELVNPVVDIVNLYTSFEPLRGNLMYRTNGLFNNFSESFQYDALDRLTHYTNALGNQIQQTYENDGRIKENTIGKYNYSNTAKKFQNTSIDVNPASKAYYENRQGIYNDSMEQQVGWTTYYDPTVLSYDATIAHTGITSIKINNTTSSEKMIFAESWIAIDNAVPTEYTYSAWVKSDGTNPQAEVFMYMKTANETAYVTQFDQIQATTSTGWIKIEKTVLVPANIKKLNIRLDNNTTGVLWYDDVQIRKTSEATPAERQLNISYNTWKSPYEINETGVDRISFTYNHMNNRSSMFYGGLQTDKMQRQYRKHYSADGSMEIKHNTVTGAVEFVTYVGGDGYTAPVVYKNDGTTGEFLYLHRDYLGSIVAITNQAGNVVEKRLFDAWGEVLKVVDGQGTVLTDFKVLDRGYTGHEHLQSVGLVHMNGRLYDAKLHRFLQPDNNIQDPYNAQNYNRYAYVLNNPLKYNDPSGEFWNIVAAAVIGYVSGVQASGGELNPTKWDSNSWTNAALGAVSFGATVLATNSANNYIDNYNSQTDNNDYVIQNADIHAPYEPKFEYAGLADNESDGFSLLNIFGGILSTEYSNYLLKKSVIAVYNFPNYAVNLYNTQIRNYSKLVGSYGGHFANVIGYFGAMDKYIQGDKLGGSFDALSNTISIRLGGIYSAAWSTGWFGGELLSRTETYNWLLYKKIFDRPNLYNYREKKYGWGESKVFEYYEKKGW